MTNDFFGLHTIARAACIKPRTLQSWYRQERHRADFSIKMPREYERSMGIILLDLFPNREGQISKLVCTNYRTLHQWRVENRFRPLDSDLIYRTFQGVLTLQRPVKKQIQKFGEDKFLTDKMLWPDPNLIYEKTWRELDELLHLNLMQLQYRNLGITGTGTHGPLPPHIKKTNIGPHVMRYTEVSYDGYKYPSKTYQANRRTKHLIGAGTREALEKAKIAKELLPPNWKMNDSFAPFRSRTESKLLMEIYEGVPNKKKAPSRRQK
jgi:hypothetical protein